MLVQTQTRAGQCTRFKAFCCYWWLQWPCGSRSEGHSLKLSVAPFRRGYWGNKLSKPHTLCVSSLPPLCLPLWPRSCLWWPVQITATPLLGAALPPTLPRPPLISKIYSYLTPDLWKEDSLHKWGFSTSRVLSLGEAWAQCPTQEFNRIMLNCRSIKKT